ncbi:hypothetical protein CVT25_011756 [Psilocybe cyanescens]|uniref:Uncharacterized protein n=1 Tax=Psilocybe cyanescens TaxID=93625 RepID=A0A409WIE3_PSICY|nr:hypothetical protein CVT25_011756 [Psilocybe cyanescens]
MNAQYVPSFQSARKQKSTPAWRMRKNVVVLAITREIVQCGYKEAEQHEQRGLLLFKPSQAIRDSQKEVILPRAMLDISICTEHRIGQKTRLWIYDSKNARSGNASEIPTSLTH